MTKRKMGMTESRSAFIHNWQVNSFLLRIIHTDFCAYLHARVWIRITLFETSERLMT